MPIHIVLPSAPVTKKNSPRVMPMISMKGIKALIAELARATSHKDCVKILMRSISISVQPSENYIEWFDRQYLMRASLHSQLAAAGVRLPIMEPVAIKALIYREALRGDWTGYVDAIGDAIQADVWQCQECKKKTITLANCPHCGASIARMRQARRGLGIIADDKQIVHWDGSRLLKDSQRPRIELTIETLRATPQASLFANEQEEVIA
jgi:hypothetical protein